MCEVEDARSRTGKMYKVHFSPAFCPFRLERKAHKCPGRVRRSVPWPAIESIEPCESVPVRCIAVSSDDHLFLAGRGLRLTHNTHRFTLPRLKRAHRTMLANIPKRKLSDAWSLETTTAPAPGQGSVAENTMDYARQVADGKIADSRLFFFHRQASDEHDLATPEGVKAAVLEASGPIAEWSDIDGIVEQWRDPTADRSYLERVWLNRLVRSSERAFDAERWRELADPDYKPPAGDMITLGFDGARYHDATAIVGTHVESGFQWVVGAWERPHGVEGWEVPAREVNEAVAAAFARWDVWRLYCDPPYWEETVARWAGEYGEKRVWDWWTNRLKPMAYALKAYVNAMMAGELSHSDDVLLNRHIGNACRRMLKMRDEQEQLMWVMTKERPESPHKIDAAMAAVLSWEARRDALAAGVVGDSHSVYETRGVLTI